MKNWPWYGYVILGGIVLGLLFFLYYKPKNDELKSVRAERVKMEEEVTRLRAKKQQLDQIEAELESLNKTLKDLEAIIPLKKEISEILRRIQQLAYDSRLTIRRFAPRGEIDREFYSEWPIPIEITGSYHNLGIFFDRLSRFSRLFNIESFSIKSIPRQTEDETITSNFTAKTYIFLEESAAQPAQKAPRKKK